jgi:dihydroxyacid dehydratase/phosphogluconate dehydratase
MILSGVYSSFSFGVAQLRRNDIESHEITRSLNMSVNKTLPRVIMLLVFLILPAVVAAGGQNETPAQQKERERQEQQRQQRQQKQQQRQQQETQRQQQ